MSSPSIICPPSNALSSRHAARISRARRWRRAAQLIADDTGSATAEYAVATMAAVGFAGLLVVILRGDDVRSMLTDLIHRALTVGG